VSLRNLFLVFVIGVVGLVGFITNKGFTQQKNEPDLALIVRTKGLKEAAKVQGVYVNDLPTASWGKYTLEGLVSHSSVIIVGTPVASASSLADSERRIVTSHKVRVDQILKGKLQQNQVLDVVVPGGKITFEDGTSAEIRTPDLGSIEQNQTYVMFLAPGEPADSFGLTGVGQGLFQISTTASFVKPLGSKLDLVKEYSKETSTSFIRQIKLAVKKYPQTIACCK
jgi:hypothetical protein